MRRVSGDGCSVSKSALSVFSWTRTNFRGRQNSLFSLGFGRESPETQKAINRFVKTRNLGRVLGSFSWGMSFDSDPYVSFQCASGFCCGWCQLALSPSDFHFFSRVF